MLKKILISAIILIIFASAAYAEQTESVIIVNETGYSLNYIYFSPSDFDDWGDDILEGNSLADGDSIEVNLDREYDGSKYIYDLQAVDEDDDYYSIYEADISENNTITVTMENYDGGYDDYEDYDEYDDYGSYQEGYNEGYSEGYKQGYVEAFRDAYLEGFKAASEAETTEYDGWR